MEKGFIVILATLLVLSAGLVIVLSAGYISLSNIRAVRNNIYSVQAYYTAEAGIEDSLLRLSRGMKFSKNNSLTVGNGTATIEITDPVGGSRTIISSGNLSNRIRKIRVIYTINTDNISFHYGAQAGDGGIVMENNSRIKGNVFSNGSIIGIGGKGYIDYTAKIATAGTIAEGLNIGEDVYAHNCRNCKSEGIFYYSGGDKENCIADGGTENSPVQETKNLPISEEQITEWKNDADCDNCVLFGDYTVSKNAIEYLGPNKIQGNLILENNSKLIVTGTLWVTDNITINNGALIELDNTIYGSASGIIIADGKINVLNGADIQGSGEEGSYTILLSTNNSQYLGDPAINVNNNVQGAIFYTTSGLIRLRNSMEIREATGYKIYLDNNAIIEYESGLEDVNFSSGPGGSWKVIEWKEIE